MKYIIEFGYPQSALENHPCGVSGSIQFSNKKDAISAANNLVFVLSKGKKYTSQIVWDVSKNKPRQTYWDSMREFWVCMSALDGVMRGAYSAHADKMANAKYL